LVERQSTYFHKLLVAKQVGADGRPTELAREAATWISHFRVTQEQYAYLIRQHDTDITKFREAEHERLRIAIAKERKPVVEPLPDEQMVRDAIALRRKHEVLRARAARNTQEQRMVAAALKDSLPRNTTCPYCGVHMGSRSHCDHIWPVSRGGHSTIENMVYICLSCNRNKSNQTLREFARSHNLDFSLIERRLEDMGKVF